MRWGVHWRIGKDSLHGRKSLAFQLGTILPDWFERHPIHRRKESFDLVLKRIGQLREMKPGIKRDWYAGTVAHYLCDYCCTAHNEEYYRFYRHRIYEVRSQDYFKAVREKRKTGYIADQMRFVQRMKREYPALFDGSLPNDRFCAETAKLIRAVVQELHRRIQALHAKEWWTDLRVAELDVRYSYRLICTVLCILDAYRGERGK